MIALTTLLLQCETEELHAGPLAQGVNVAYEIRDLIGKPFLGLVFVANDFHELMFASVSVCFSAHVDCMCVAQDLMVQERLTTVRVHLVSPKMFILDILMFDCQLLEI